MMRTTYAVVIFYILISISYAQNADQFNTIGIKGPNVKLLFDRQNYNRGKRQGQPRDTHMCDTITRVPSNLKFISSHYQKFTHAYDIPIISSSRVSDAALKRACYVARFLLADRRVIRKSLYENWGRLGVIGQNEGTTSIPEHKHLGTWWDQRARGLGGTLHIPISTGGEENLLCWSKDRYWNEDIFLHEFSHGIQEVAIRGGAIPSYFGRLTAAYRKAKSLGLWRNTYSMSTVQEYFAEGVQSFFEVNAYAATANGVHGNINTRSKLQKYDPTLYGLIVEVFPCKNQIKKRCDKTSKEIPFKMNCDVTKPKTTTLTASRLTTTPFPEPPEPPKTTTNPPEPPEPPKTTTSLPEPPEPPTSTVAPPETSNKPTISTAYPEPPEPPTTKPPPKPDTLAPPPPPKTTVPPRCRDTTRNCYYWYYYCSTNMGTMKACPSLCGCCSNPRNGYRRCEDWAKRGECTKNPRYMLVNCKKSCCRVATG